jgi:hypothetical protein
MAKLRKKRWDGCGCFWRRPRHEWRSPEQHYRAHPSGATELFWAAAGSNVSATEILFAFDRFSGLEGSGDRRAGDQSDEKIVIVRGASKYVASLNVFRIRRATFLNLGATVCSINCINLLRCFYQALPPNIPDGPPVRPERRPRIRVNLAATLWDRDAFIRSEPLPSPTTSIRPRPAAATSGRATAASRFSILRTLPYDSPNVVNLTWWATGASQGVVKLPYCSPGSLSAGPYSSGSATPPPGAGADYDNLFLGCTPRLNGNTAGSAPGVTVSIAERIPP